MHWKTLKNLCIKLFSTPCIFSPIVVIAIYLFRFFLHFLLSKNTYLLAENHTNILPDLNLFPFLNCLILPGITESLVPFVRGFEQVAKPPQNSIFYLKGTISLAVHCEPTTSWVVDLNLFEFAPFLNTPRKVSLMNT